MSFTDQKAWVVSEEEASADWGTGNSSTFRCFFCGHKFVAGDVARWVYMNSTPGALIGNLFVCKEHDGDDVRERVNERCIEARDKFWWLWDQ